jgi:CRP-like cAMP-binding protein
MNPKNCPNLAYYLPFFGGSLFDHTETHDPLAGVKHTSEFEKGATLFSAGDESRGIYRLVKGRVDLRAQGPPEEMPATRKVEINEVLGLTETILGIPYKANATAVSACRCEYVPRDDLIRVLREDPKAAFPLVENLATHLQKNYQVFFFQ